MFVIFDRTLIFRETDFVRENPTQALRFLDLRHFELSFLFGFYASGYLRNPNRRFHGQAELQ
jgi:hypothetical protein